MLVLKDARATGLNKGRNAVGLDVRLALNAKLLLYL